MKPIQNPAFVRTTVKRKARALLVAFVTLFLIGGVGSMSSPASADSSARIEGSWISVITIPTISFTALSSFTAGGVFLATGSLDRANPVSPLYGSWKRIGPRRFSSTAYFFAFDPANPNSEAVAILKTTSEYQLTNSDEMVGAGNVSSCDLQGQNCVPGGTLEFTGKRIVPESLSQ